MFLKTYHQVRDQETEAKEEDVEMEEVKEEEPPQDDPNAQLAPEEEAPDFGGDIDDDVSETASQKMQRANRLLNSGILDRYANSSDEEDEFAPRLGPTSKTGSSCYGKLHQQLVI